MNRELEHNFVELLEKHQNIIHKVCRLYTNNYDAHNDLFQEITIQLWKAYPKFRGDSKFSTWMYRVGLNTAITLYRKSKRMNTKATMVAIVVMVAFFMTGCTKEAVTAAPNTEKPDSTIHPMKNDVYKKALKAIEPSSPFILINR